jgi:hypothetical protein
VSEIVSLGEKFLDLAMSGPEGAEKAWKFAAEKLNEKSG